MMANETMPVAAAGENQLHSLWAENARLRQGIRAALAAWQRWLADSLATDYEDVVNEMERLRELTT